MASAIDTLLQRLDAAVAKFSETASPELTGQAFKMYHGLKKELNSTPSPFNVTPLAEGPIANAVRDFANSIDSMLSQALSEECSKILNHYNMLGDSNTNAIIRNMLEKSHIADKCGKEIYNMLYQAMIQSSISSKFQTAVKSIEVVIATKFLQSLEKNTFAGTSSPRSPGPPITPSPVIQKAQEERKNVDTVAAKLSPSRPANEIAINNAVHEQAPEKKKVSFFGSWGSFGSLGKPKKSERPKAQVDNPAPTGPPPPIVARSPSFKKAAPPVPPVPAPPAQTSPVKQTAPQVQAVKTEQINTKQAREGVSHQSPASELKDVQPIRNSTSVHSMKQSPSTIAIPIAPPQVSPTPAPVVEMVAQRVINPSTNNEKPAMEDGDSRVLSYVKQQSHSAMGALADAMKQNRANVLEKQTLSNAAVETDNAPSGGKNPAALGKAESSISIVSGNSNFNNYELEKLDAIPILSEDSLAPAKRVSNPTPRPVSISHPEQSSPEKHRAPLPLAPELINTKKTPEFMKMPSAAPIKDSVENTTVTNPPNNAEKLGQISKKSNPSQHSTSSLVKDTVDSAASPPTSPTTPPTEKPESPAKKGNIMQRSPSSPVNVESEEPVTLPTPIGETTYSTSEKVDSSSKKGFKSQNSTTAVETDEEEKTSKNLPALASSKGNVPPLPKLLVSQISTGPNAKNDTTKSASVSSTSPVDAKHVSGISGDDKAIERAAIAWINHFLKEEKVHVDLDTLFNVFSNGVNLSLALQAATQMAVKFNKKPTLQVHKIDNISMCLKVLDKHGVSTQFMSPQDILDGTNHKKLLALFSYLVNAFPIPGA